MQCDQQHDDAEPKHRRTATRGRATSQIRRTRHSQQYRGEIEHDGSGRRDQHHAKPRHQRYPACGHSHECRNSKIRHNDSEWPSCCPWPCASGSSAMLRLLAPLLASAAMSAAYAPLITPAIAPFSKPSSSAFPVGAIRAVSVRPAGHHRCQRTRPMCMLLHPWPSWSRGVSRADTCPGRPVDVLLIDYVGRLGSN